MGIILIGTSGYSYRDWSGSFYPPEIRPDEYLAYFASVFSFTELNFSYYRQPQKTMTEAMARAVPPGFRFSIKGHRSLTHEVTADWRKDAAEFMRGIEPLSASQRLAGVLLQFPFAFHYIEENRKYLSLLTRELSAVPLFIEFRNAEWLHGQVYDEMRSRGLATVALDMPELPGLPVGVPPVTAERGYVRFHGRNAAQWWKGDNVTRYDYLYTPEELAAWVPVLTDIAAKTAVLLVAFNNHYKGKGPQNALQLKGLLSGSPHEVK